MRPWLIDIMTEQMLWGGLSPSPYVSPNDKLFFEHSHCRYPQHGPSEQTNGELLHLDYGERGLSNKRVIAGIKKYKAHIQETWITNPVKFDPSYLHYLDRTSIRSI